MYCGTHAKSVLSIVYNYGSKLLVYAVVLSLVLTNQALIGAVIFPATALLHVLRGSFFSRLSMALQFTGEALVSIKRAQVI